MATSSEDTEIEKQHWHWRNSMRPVLFVNLDARAALPFSVLLFYARPITLLLAAVSTAIFMFLERRGLTFPAAMRSLRVWIIGDERPGWYPHRKRQLKDYG